MPKVLIMSDSHGLTSEVAEIKNRHIEEVDQLIHCGDSELAFDAKELADIIKVTGNCDIDEKFPEQADFLIDDLRFLVTHGHLYQVKSTLMPLSYKAEETGAQVVCFGHTHIAGAEQVGNKLFINPGSIRLPRGRKEKTYVILSWQDKADIKVEFFNIDGKVVRELTCKANLL